MIEISEELKEYINNSPSRCFNARIDINGSPASVDIRSLSIKKGSCDGSSFQPASIFSNSLSATLDIKEGYQDIKSGDKIEVYFCCPLCSDKSWYKACTVYASKPSRKIKRVNLTGEGAISAKLGRKYTGTTPTTINELIEQIKTATGVNIILDDLDGSYAINKSAKLSNLLYREIVSYIAGCFFGYATEDSENNIVIRTFGKNSGKSVTLKNSRMFEEAEVFDTATVEGIQIITSDGENEVEYMYPAGATVANCSLNNPLMTEELFNAHASNYVGFSITPYNASMTLGDFSVEPTDLILIEQASARSNIATMPMSIDIQYDGGIKTELSCPSIDNGEDYSRDVTEMKSDIAFGNYPTAEGNGGDVNVEPADPTGRYTFSKNGYIASKTSGKTNVFIKDNAIAFIEQQAQVYGYRGILVPDIFNKLEEKFLPAYPVKVCIRGYTGSNGTAVGSQYAYPTAVQIDILPELNESGYVKTCVSFAYLDPKGYNRTWNRYDYEDPSTRSFGYWNNYDFRVQYLLKSYVDSLNKEEGSENE